MEELFFESEDLFNNRGSSPVTLVSGSLLGSNAQVVSLPSDGYDPAAGLAVTVTGWGRTRTGGPAASTLQKVDISISDRSYCQSFFSSVVTPRMVCAGQAGKSVCNGDSGGPLLQQEGFGL
ncbi:trypsin alpha-4-like [Schistocerca nitens]|uniref:trypsin alpha-4-like n=1 Tax=Schistocerca nitens TaxID=7011 RepID=UPI0021186CA7|nr:trypsin alpha-4-like [Schistocerca nitens]